MLTEQDLKRIELSLEAISDPMAQEIQTGDVDALLADHRTLNAQVNMLTAELKEMTGLRDEWKTKWEKDHLTNLDNVALCLLIRSERDAARQALETVRDFVQMRMPIGVVYKVLGIIDAALAAERKDKK